MCWKSIAVFIFCFILTFPFYSNAEISCKDQNNKNVDWFTAYKMPKIKDNSLPGVGNGTAFYYMDVNMDSFEPSANDLSTNQQAIAYTLQQYYDNKALTNNFSYVLYNDEKPENASHDDDFFPYQRQQKKYFHYDIFQSERIETGHTKGVVFFGKDGGFWLIHSLPKFPPSDSYEMFNNSKVKGQSILCISFKYEELTKIGTQLFYNHPPIYASNLAPSMAAENPDLAKVLSKQYKKGSPFSSTLYLQSRGGQKYTSFAKSADFGQDLYDVLVAPSLQVPMYTETWRDGYNISLDCNAKYLVLDAETMKVGKTREFKFTTDHSKLAISTDSTKPYICIGDINRMTSQFTRGGGTVCIQLKKLWDNYRPMFLTENSCK